MKGRNITAISHRKNNFIDRKSKIIYRYISRINKLNLLGINLM